MAKRGWTDAFVTGDEFGTFLKEQDAAVADILTAAGAGSDATDSARRPAEPGRGPRAVRRVRGPRPARRPGPARREPHRRRGEQQRPGRARGPCRSSSASCSSSSSVFYAIDVSRGGVGGAEAGEDIDLTTASTEDGRPAHRRLRPQRRCSSSRSAGSSAARILFWGAAFALGNRHHIRGLVDRRGARPHHLLRVRHRARRQPARPASSRESSDGQPRQPHRRLRRRPDTDEPALRPPRRHRRHRRRRPAGHRPGHDRGAAAADHLRPGADPGPDPVRRHLLRRHVRRVDDLDPAQHPG